MNSRPVKSRPGLMLREFSQIIRTRLSNKLAEIGLTPVWFAALGALISGKAETGAELARYFSTDPTAVTRTIDRMETAGFVTRERSAKDRRVFVIKVTEKGKKAFPKAKAIADENEQLFFGVLSEEQKDMFVDTLAKLIANASKMSPEIDWEN